MEKSEELFNNDEVEFEDELFQVDFKKEKIKNKHSDKNFQFIYEDFRRSGINIETVNKYIQGGYLTGDEDSWELFYPELTDNIKTYYNTTRLKSPKNGQGKYIKPEGQTTRLFRPLALTPNKLFDKNEYIIITEGDKKAIKAVQEGFNCISLSGTWNWKMKPVIDDKEGNKQKSEEEAELYADIIPDLKNIDFENKPILLCYDADLWEKPQVKQALYQFAAFLISEKGAVVKIILLPKAGAKGIDDFLVAHDAEEFQKLIDSAKAVTLKDIQKELSDKKDLKEFPIEIFPDKISDLIKDMNKKYDASIEYIACVFLSVVSIIVCGHFYIKARPSSNWDEHPILWIVLIGDPSRKKSPCLKIGKKILDAFDVSLEGVYETQKTEYARKYEDYKNEVEKRKKRIKNNESPGEIPQEPEKPSRARLTTQNATVESLFSIINANSKYKLGVALYIDELSFLLKGFNQYKKSGNDRQYFLQSWDRDRQNIVRKSDKMDITIDVGHNIIGGIQPKVLYKTLLNEGIDSTDGMVERWLFCCTDYLEKGFSCDNENEPHTIDVDNDLEKMCKELFGYIFEHLDKTTEFSFDNEAQKGFFDFYNKTIRKNQTDNLNDLTKSYLQKQTSYVARFALILQCFYDFKSTVISKNIIEKAIKLSDFFVNCFYSVINEKLEANPLEDAAISYLKAKNLKSISPTKLFKSNEYKYKSGEKAKHILENLARKGYGRLIKAKNGVKFVFYGS